eukprot:GHVT01079069.1.p2 GENE.GHVT01079069.1~~GHVT01079069.1.p2  ORF type:complete len:119 (+),score=21.23 GHVT01079069.1:753-1109(+)
MAAASGQRDSDVSESLWPNSTSLPATRSSEASVPAETSQLPSFAFAFAAQTNSPPIASARAGHPCARKSQGLPGRRGRRPPHALLKFERLNFLSRPRGLRLPHLRWAARAGKIYLLHA